MSQIRITKSTELEKILQFLKVRWPLLDETEIVKMALSKFYYDQLVEIEDEEYLDKNSSYGISVSKMQIREGKAKQYKNAKKLLDDIQSGNV